MERADEPVEDGTLTNKELFDSIKSGNDLVQKFNTVELSKTWDDYNHLKLDNIITEYEKGMRVLIEIPTGYEIVDGNLIPTFSSNSDVINGLKITYNNTVNNAYHAYDGNSETYAQKPSGVATHNTTLNIVSTISKYYPINLKIKYKVVGAGLYSDYNDMRLGIYKSGWVKNFTCPVKAGESDKWIEKEFEMSGDIEMYDSASLTFLASTSSTGIVWSIAEIQVTKYKVEKVNSGLYSYLNINGLGEKLINQKLEMGKKYELLYDGETFNATEVV